VLGSEDFKDRIAKSKFRQMPDFAKSNIGYIVLQGDHGRVCFRNIKIRPISSNGLTDRRFDGETVNRPTASCKEMAQGDTRNTQLRIRASLPQPLPQLVQQLRAQP
jgi:hypothetical protein